jgi:hypothetical protein
MVLLRKLTTILLLMFVLSPANATVLTADFNNLQFAGGEVVNGSISYDDAPSCCTAISGSITAMGGIFTGETVVWDAADVFAFDDSALLAFTKDTTLFTHAALIIRGNPGAWTTLGDFAFRAGTEVNRDGVLPNAYVSGTITISQHAVPEPSTIALLSLGLAGLGFTRRRKKA